jgi:WXXGXW repeat (2 copies)
MKLENTIIPVVVLGVVGCAEVERDEPRTVTTSTYERTVRRAPEAVVVTRPMPARRVERTIVSPGPDHVWIRGHWAWQDNDWVWVPGQWVQRPERGVVYRESTYVRRGSQHTWVPGHWE